MEVLHGYCPSQPDSIKCCPKQSTEEPDDDDQCQDEEEESEEVGLVHEVVPKVRDILRREAWAAVDAVSQRAGVVVGVAVGENDGLRRNERVSNGRQRRWLC